MAYTLKNKIVLVTGGANGIGARVVELLLEEDVKHVAVLDLTEDIGVAAQDTLNAKYGANKVKFYKCDVTKDDQFLGAFDSTVKENGYIDVVINNAGILNDSWEKYKKEIEINVTALVTGTLKAIDIMRKDRGGKGGTVINISSVAGLCQAASFPIYWATKTAVIQFSNCIGLDKNYSRLGVRVVAVCFGATDTSLITKPKIGAFDEEIDKDLENFLKYYPMQRLESAARGVIDTFKQAESGSTWIATNDNPAKDITGTITEAYELMAKHIKP